MQQGAHTYQKPIRAWAARVVVVVWRGPAVALGARWLSAGVMTLRIPFSLICLIEMTTRAKLPRQQWTTWLWPALASNSAFTAFTMYAVWRM